jgi:Uma2 family endonuclease
MASVLTETELETVFDAPPVRYLGPESNGMLMTPEEFAAVEDWDELYKYELVHGVVIVSPPPPEGERGPNGRLDQWLWNYHDDHPNGSSLDDTLPEQEYDTPSGIRRADRVIWCGLGRQPKPKTDVPAIVIEFVAKRARDRRRDYEEKRADYAAIGVKEYWVIDRHRRTMTVCRGESDLQIIREADTYRTDLLPGFELSLAKLLAVADRWEAAE